MSRTKRRKNQEWLKYQYVEAWVEDDGYWDDYFQGVNWHGRGSGKYHGCSKEQILAKLNAKWYGEVSQNWDRSARRKLFCRWWVRNQHRKELTQYLHRLDDYDLVLTEPKRNDECRWWYWD